MRLPTVNQFKSEMTTLSNQYDRIQNLQTQVTTGKKLQSASEDPLLADRINAVGDFVQNVKGYQLNGTLAETRVSLASSNIQQSINEVDRIRELIQTAQNDTLNNGDRKNIALELQGHLDNLLQVANARESSGEYIFSGINVHGASFENQGGRYVYQGAQEVTRIAINNQNTVPFNDSGLEVFGNIKTGNGLYSLSSAVSNTGTGVVTSGGSLQNTAYVPDNYTITFVTNSSGNLAWQVTGLTSGQIIPAPPLITPGDAPEFQPNTDMAFNGVNLQFAGLPQVGDTFQVEQSTSQNMFNMLQDIINTLNTSVNTEQERASFHQALGNQSSSFRQVANHLNGFLTELANRQNNITDQIAFSNNILTEQKILLGKLSDVDITEVISDLTQRLTTLEITQQSYLKIQDTLNRLLKV